MKDILDALEYLQFHFHENIKFHVCLAYYQIADGMMHLNGVMNEDNRFIWKRGPANESPLPQQVVEYLDQIVFPYYYRLFDEEENKEVIERVLENLREMSEDYGPAAF